MGLALKNYPTDDIDCCKMFIENLYKISRQYNAINENSSIEIGHGSIYSLYTLVAECIDCIRLLSGVYNEYKNLVSRVETYYR